MALAPSPSSFFVPAKTDSRKLACIVQKVRHAPKRQVLPIQTTHTNNPSFLSFFPSFPSFLSFFFLLVRAAMFPFALSGQVMKPLPVVHEGSPSSLARFTNVFPKKEGSLGRSLFEILRFRACMHQQSSCIANFRDVSSYDFGPLFFSQPEQCQLQKFCSVPGH